MTEQKKQQVITNEEFIKARPWICCRDPFYVATDKATGLPLVAQCDRKDGHAGKHRGRLDGGTYIWRKRSPAETKRILDKMVAATEAHNKRVAEAKASSPLNLKPRSSIVIAWAALVRWFKRWMETRRKKS